MAHFDADNTVALRKGVTFTLCGEKHAVLPFTDELMEDLDQMSAVDGVGPNVLLRRQLGHITGKDPETFAGADLRAMSATMGFVMEQHIDPLSGQKRGAKRRG